MRGRDLTPSLPKLALSPLQCAAVQKHLVHGGALVIAAGLMSGSLGQGPPIPKSNLPPAGRVGGLRCIAQNTGINHPPRTLQGAPDTVQTIKRGFSRGVKSIALGV